MTRIRLLDDIKLELLSILPVVTNITDDQVAGPVCRGTLPVDVDSVYNLYPFIFSGSTAEIFAGIIKRKMTRKIENGLE